MIDDWLNLLDKEKTISLLSDDDSVELFKKTLPNLALFQM